MPIGPELITVVVCSIGDAGDSLEACLNALAAAGVLNPVVLRAEEGMATLRNRALAECGSPVIAFVDDDVIVEPGWLDELARAWDSAAPRVACIGGPIEAQLHPDSPAWMTESLARAASANTPVGNDPSDPLLRTFCGGNVSFRADALRGVQGFWPVRGAGRLRDWFSEEHHAQRELARSGWTALMVPQLAAIRTSGQRASVRRLASDQAKAGARRRRLGGAHESELVPAIKSATGAVVAAMRRDSALAAERAVRSAGHAGTAVPRIADITVEATAPSTPFRHSVPSVSPKRTRRSRSAVTYCYHRVNDDFIPSGLAVSTAAFRSQLAELMSRGTPAPADAVAAGTAPRNSFAITFDDGYVDNLRVALPILEEFEVPATFFIATEHVIKGRGFWWDQVSRLLGKTADAPRERGVLSLSCEGETRSWAPTTEEQLRETSRHVTSWLQSKDPEAIAQTLEELERWAGFSPDAEPDRPMTPEELLELSRHPLVTVGAHTRTHPNLRFCGPERLDAELSGARSDLADLVDQDVDILAYPFGVWGADVDDQVLAAADRAGYRFAFLNGGSPSRPNALGSPRRAFAHPGFE